MFQLEVTMEQGFEVSRNLSFRVLGLLGSRISGYGGFGY
jgi:hypothetical protein